MEENEISSERGLNNDFVVQFAALNTELTTSDIDGWFHADGPGYKHLDEQEIVDFLVAERNECDEEEDADKNTQHLTQKVQCPFSRAEAMQMFDRCLTWLRIQPEATVSNTSSLVRYDIASLLLKNANLPENNLKLIPILVDLVLQVTVMREIS